MTDEQKKLVVLAKSAMANIFKVADETEDQELTSNASVVWDCLDRLEEE